MQNIIVIGAGGHGEAVAEAIELSKSFNIVGFVDDCWLEKKSVFGFPVLGNLASLSDFLPLATLVIVAIGKNSVRQLVQSSATAAGFTLATVLHPTAIISPSVLIGEGSVVMAGAILGTRAQLGVGVIVNSGAIVDHHCTVGDYGHLSVNACMAGSANLGSTAWLQAGSSLAYGVSVPAGAVISAGVGLANA